MSDLNKYTNFYSNKINLELFFLTFRTIYTIITTMKNLNTLRATLAPTNGGDRDLCSRVQI